MSYTLSVRRTEHRVTIHRSIFGALAALFAVLNLSNGDIAGGVALTATAVWLSVSTTFEYDAHVLVAGALAGCAVHAGVYETVVRPAGYAIGVVAVALYWKYVG